MSTEPELLHARGSVQIAAPVAKVWAIAGDYSDLTWVPAVKKSSSTLGNRLGSVRTLDFGGPVATETLVEYDGVAHAYTYQIIKNKQNAELFPLSDVEAAIWVFSDGHDGSIATWIAQFRRADHGANPAAGKDDAAARQQMSDTIRNGLAGLKAKVERS